MASDTASREKNLLPGRRVDALYRLDKFISSIYSIDKLLDLIMQEAESGVGAEASSIALYDSTDNLLHIEFASGEKKDEVRHLCFSIGQGIMGEVAETKEQLLIDDVPSDPRFDPSVDVKTGFTTRCILATPITRRDEFIGVLEVINKRDGGCFTEEDTHLLKIIANQAAIAVENARLYEKMVRSERLSLVGRMAASIIHDLKGPMAIVKGFIELLKRPDLPAEKRSHFSDLVLQATDRMVDMTQDLLSYSQGQVDLKIREVQIGDWLEYFASFLRQDFVKSKVSIVNQLEYSGPVYIDSDRMWRVMMNIAGNARDAMPNGGTFTIATSSNGEQWRLALTDTGCGIPAELQSKIFEPFVTSRKAGGTGLGLAISCEIIERHGGTINVESIDSDGVTDQPSGSTFLITLPVFAQQKLKEGCRPELVPTISSF